MLKLIVSFAQNRDIEGKIHLEENGRLLAGPFPVCGRADDAAAERHANPSRNPLLPFGDTPLGHYQVVGLLPSGGGTALSKKIFGPHHVVVLKPTGGDAALADANGRFNTLIQGGKESRGGRLLPTNGSLRLRDKDQKKLLRALAAKEGVDCECEVRMGTVKGKPVELSLPYELGDPLSGPALNDLRKFVIASMFVIGTTWNMIHSFNSPIFKYLTNSSRLNETLSVEKSGKKNSFGSPSGGGGGPLFMAGDSYGNNDNNSGGSPSALGQLKTLASQGENADWDGRNSNDDQGTDAASQGDSQAAGSSNNAVAVPLTPFNWDNQPVKFENENQPEDSTGNASQSAAPENNPSASLAGSDGIESSPETSSDESSASSQGWSRAQAILPSIALFSTPETALRTNTVPVPQFSQSERDAAAQEAKRQKFLDDRNYLVKGLESQLSSGVATINDTIPPDARKLLWSFVAFNGVIEKSFELGGKISDDAWEDAFGPKKALGALWSREGYGLVVELAKEIGGTELSQTVSEIHIGSGSSRLTFKKVEDENTILGRWFKKGEDKMVSSREQELLSIIHPDWTTDKMATTHNPLDWVGDRVNHGDLQDISGNIKDALEIDEWSEKTELGKKLTEGFFSKPSEDSEKK